MAETDPKATQEPAPAKPTQQAQPGAQDYDYDTLVSAATSYADPESDAPTPRTWMVEGALRLYAAENDIADVRDVRLTRDAMLAALDAWSTRADPTYVAEEAG